MNRTIMTLGAIGAGLLVLALATCTFIVDQTRQALVLEFGRPLNSGIVNVWKADQNWQNDETGLKFKLPWQTVVQFDRRNLEYFAPQAEILASDQQRLLVDAFIRWRIVDPLRFYQSVRSEVNAANRLNTQLTGVLRDVLGRATTPQIISERRAELMQEIRTVMNRDSQQFGINIIDVRIRQADLPEANAARVFDRMVSERAQEAARIRATGAAEATEIRAEAEATARRTIATATEESQKLRGEGDALRNKIYADSFGRDAEFAAFYRSLQSYEKSITANDTLIISPDSPYFRYFGNPRGGR